jgi:hypothetical protein
MRCVGVFLFWRWWLVGGLVVSFSWYLNSEWMMMGGDVLKKAIYK